MRSHVRAHAKHAQAIVLDSQSMPYMDVSAVRMDLGQVRDVVRRSGEDTVLRLYPTVEAALDAVRHSGGGTAR